MGFTKVMLLAAVAVAGWYFYRRFVADALKLARASQTRRQEERNQASGTLVQDPVTGEYRVRREQEN